MELEQANDPGSERGLKNDRLRLMRSELKNRALNRHTDPNNAIMVACHVQ